jgi:hypothetical protein
VTKAGALLPLNHAIRTLYDARRPLTAARRMRPLVEHEAAILESIEAALDILEMAEAMKLARTDEPKARELSPGRDGKQEGSSNER